MLQATDKARPLVAPFTVQRVTDTRAYVEDGDRFVPVPGSGDPRECDRCNRVHEIHAEIIDAAGRHGVVGVGCMDATTAVQRSLSGKATRQARNQAKELATAAALAVFRGHAAAVDALPFPADRVTRAPSTFGKQDPDRPAQEWRLDDAGPVIVDHWANHGERMGCLEGSWRRKRMVERVGGSRRAVCARASRRRALQPSFQLHARLGKTAKVLDSNRRYN